MRKYVYIAALTFLSFGLIACGGGESQQTASQDQSTQQQATQTDESAASQEEMMAEGQSQQASDDSMESESTEDSEETESSEEDTTKTGININTASSSQLQTMDGVGPATAEAIISYRDENDGFDSLDELDQVDGIGSATLEGIRPDAKVSGETKMPGDSGEDEGGEEESGDSEESAEEESAPSGDAINLNTASSSELQELDGVGPATADAIIKYREENSFGSKEDFKKVDGIGPVTYENNKDMITVGE
jgi:comEA protein